MMVARALRLLDLREWEQSEPHTLSVAERDTLLGVVPSLTISPVKDAEATYRITPGSVVGAVEIGDLSVLIRPKIDIGNLLVLACYAMGMFELQHENQFDFEEESESLPDTLALALASSARRAFSRGLLHGYVTEEEALQTVRGRIRFDEQLRRRFGLSLPVEVTYDEFTDDIMENRLVRTAVVQLSEMRLRSSRARRDLGWIAAMLENVSHFDFAPDDVPKVSFNRLNEHYRGVVGISRLILQNSAFESRSGEVRATGFLMDMNNVFQEFVTVALREELRLPPHSFGEKGVTSLDKAGKVRLRPDLVWREGGDFLFAGDAKYKVVDQTVPNSDLYQLLAYVTALGLPGGMLIYGEGEAEPVTHEIRHIGKQLEIAGLDLSGSLEEVLNRVKDVASRVAVMRQTAERLRTVG